MTALQQVDQTEARDVAPVESATSEQPTFPELSFADEARRINEFHRAAVAHLQHGVQYAEAAGRLLAAVKRQLPHGAWLPWLAANCDVSVRSAQLYTKLARRTAQLSNAQRAAFLTDVLSIRGALAQLSGPAHDEPESDEFPSVDMDIPTSYRCPSCGYEWNGNPKPGRPGD